MENSPAEKELRVLGEEKLDMSHQKANHILGCIPSKVASRAREGILPLYSALMRPHLESCIQPSTQERHVPVGAGPEEATKIIRGLDHLSYEERLRQLGLFCLQKWRLRGECICSLLVLEGGLYIRWGQTF